MTADVDLDVAHRSFDWATLLPPRQGSCLNLSNVEPCVNKAIYHLDALKKTAKEKEKGRSLAKPSFSEIHTEREKDVRSDSKSSKAVTSRSASGCVNKLGNVAIQSPTAHDLYVEGTTTGIEIEKDRKNIHPPQLQQGGGGQLDLDVIAGAINLVGRLEEDRQKKLVELASEKVKVQQLGLALDAEAERRLDLLGAEVQREHEECLRDILELKWHVSYEGRQLSRIKDNLRITAERNAELQKDVAYLSTNCPLLEEKIVIENDNISQIAQQQQETSDRINQAKQQLIQCEDRSHQAHSRAQAERSQMEMSLNEMRDKLKAQSDQLSQANGDHTAIKHKTNDAHKTISLHKKQSNNYDERCGQCRVRLSEIQSRVSHLRDDHTKLEAVHERMEEENTRLGKKEAAERSCLESELTTLLSSLQAEERALREGRDGNEETEQNIDTHKEQIAASLKQAADDEKSVQRARRELVKLDQQLQVSMEQHRRVGVENARLVEQLKEEDMNAGTIEHSLKTTTETLQQQLKEETKTKLMYESKSKADTAELDKLLAEGRKKIERAKNLTEEREAHSKDCSDLVVRLEETLSERQTTMESLRSQLAVVLEEHALCGRELGGRRGELTTKEMQLRSDVQEKVKTVESVTEAVQQLERKLEDVVKSTAMVQKMERNTNNAIEELESELEAVREKLAAEKREEQSWKEEFQEISDFSSSADEKHELYLQEREEFLKQNKLDLRDALSRNTSLARRYHKCQSQFIAEKTVALRIMEIKLDLEASLRDHKQLLAFQSEIYSAMTDYYKHRGTRICRELSKFSQKSQLNIKELRYLQGQLDEAVTQMQAFLETELHQLAKTRKKNVRIQE